MRKKEYEQHHSVQAADGFSHDNGEYLEDFPFSLGGLSIESGDDMFTSAPPDFPHTALGVNTSDVGTLGEVPRDSLPLYAFGTGSFDKIIRRRHAPSHRPRRLRRLGPYLARRT